MIDRTEVYSRLKEHIHRFWPGRNKQAFSWQSGPTQMLLPDFRVWRVEPATREESWVYVTIGAWEIPREDSSERLEFLLLSPVESPIHVETLAMVTYFHSNPDFPLGVGSILNIGWPWLEGSLCDRLLISLPYPFGPELEYCHLPELTVRFLWLVPITASEAEYATRNGLEALEDLLDSEHVNILDPLRPPVA